LSNERERRKEALQIQMHALGADAFLVTSPVHLFYMTGRIFDGFYYVPAQGDAVELIRRPLTPAQAGAIRLKSPAQLPDLLHGAGLPPPKHLALEDRELPYAEYTYLSGLFPGASILGGSALLYRIRMIKSPYEISLLREGAKVHDETHRRIPSLYREGMTDWAFSVEIEHQIRRMGHLGIMRCAGIRLETCSAIVLSGDSAGSPSPYDYSLPGGGRHPSAPMGPDNHVMRPGDTVNVDFCGNINGYLTDITRTYAVGYVKPEAAAAHAFSLSVMRAIEHTARPGVLCSDLYHLAWDMAESAGYADCFMGTVQQAKFIGHGIGLQVNELPVLTKSDATPLQSGMIIAIEPKLICPGVGPVGAENTYLVTEGGTERLTLCNEDIAILGHSKP